MSGLFVPLNTSAENIVLKKSYKGMFVWNYVLCIIHEDPNCQKLFNVCFKYSVIYCRCLQVKNDTQYRYFYFFDIDG